MNNQVHPIFRGILNAMSGATALDHTIARNRSQARTLAALSDAITPPPSGAHRSARVTSSPSPNPQDVTRALPSARELRRVRDSFFAARFPTLDEHYMAPPAPAPTLAETIASGRAAIDWHQDRGGEGMPDAAYHRARAQAIGRIVARLELHL